MNKEKGRNDNNNLDRIRKRESDSYQTSLLVTDKSGYRNGLKMFSNEYENNILDEEEGDEEKDEMVSDQNEIHQKQQHGQIPSKDNHKKNNDHEDQQDERRRGRHEQEEEEEIGDEDPNMIFNTEDQLFNASDIMVSFVFIFSIFLSYLVYRMDWVDLNL